ncbi:uncharacterized protein LOC116603357 isoform X3 [Nematostella vectensis]|uniref:uncharacterized protein LOC116603357 isoform X3 n=1 Tax=Nematostella vectensis TaxID=45351 RepID=UPI0020775C33|nr:uncharacterized protein LOC116603357 isoform X3 [Nematostella vectensis]
MSRGSSHRHPHGLYHRSRDQAPHPSPYKRHRRHSEDGLSHSGNYGDLPNYRFQEVGLGEFNDFSSVSDEDLKIDKDSEASSMYKHKDKVKIGKEQPDKHQKLTDMGVASSTSQPLVSPPVSSQKGGAPSSPRTPPRGEVEQIKQEKSADQMRALEQPGHNAAAPMIEDISPAKPASEDKSKSQLLSTISKEELIQSMDKLDREIAQAQQQIANLKKKQSQLEEDAQQAQTEPPKPPSPPPEQKPKSLVQVVYEENRKKAQAAHAQLAKFGYPLPDGKPLYNQPSDLPIYHENLRRAPAVKAKLVKYFQLRKQAREIKNRQLCKEYKSLKKAWLKKLQRQQNNAKRRAKEARVRDFYEKIFPEIKKQREQAERFSRMGSRSSWGIVARSEAEFNEIVDNLNEQEANEKHMRTLAVDPPPMLDEYERRRVFINRNGLIRDPLAALNERKYRNIWTEKEKQIFKEKYIEHPKDFELIAAFLENKSVSECILFYYQSKKKENYKQLARKQTLKRRRRGEQQYINQRDAHSRDKSRGNVSDSGATGPQWYGAPDSRRAEFNPRPRQLEFRQSRPESDYFDEEMTDSAEESDRDDDDDASNAVGSSTTTQTSSSNIQPAISTVTTTATTAPTVIQPAPSSSARRTEHAETSRWTEKDMEIAVQGLREHGRDWAAISRMVMTKTDAQCKNFYFNYKKKFHLENVVAEYEANKMNRAAQKMEDSNSQSSMKSVQLAGEKTSSGCQDSSPARAQAITTHNPNGKEDLAQTSTDKRPSTSGSPVGNPSHPPVHQGSPSSISTTGSPITMHTSSTLSPCKVMNFGQTSPHVEAGPKSEAPRPTLTSITGLPGVPISQMSSTSGLRIAGGPQLPPVSHPGIRHYQDRALTSQQVTSSHDMPRTSMPLVSYPPHMKKSPFVVHHPPDSASRHGNQAPEAHHHEPGSYKSPHSEGSRRTPSGVPYSSGSEGTSSNPSDAQDVIVIDFEERQGNGKRRKQTADVTSSMLAQMTSQTGHGMNAYGNDKHSHMDITSARPSSLGALAGTQPRSDTRPGHSEGLKPPPPLIQVSPTRPLGQKSPIVETPRDQRERLPPGGVHKPEPVFGHTKASSQGQQHAVEMESKALPMVDLTRERPGGSPIQEGMRGQSQQQHVGDLKSTGQAPSARAALKAIAMTAMASGKAPDEREAREREREKEHKKHEDLCIPPRHPDPKLNSYEQNEAIRKFSALPSCIPVPREFSPNAEYMSHHQYTAMMQLQAQAQAQALSGAHVHPQARAHAAAAVAAANYGHPMFMSGCVPYHHLEYPVLTPVGYQQLSLQEMQQQQHNGEASSSHMKLNVPFSHLSQARPIYHSSLPSTSSSYNRVLEELSMNPRARYFAHQAAEEKLAQGHRVPSRSGDISDHELTHPFLARSSPHLRQTHTITNVRGHSLSPGEAQKPGYSPYPEAERKRDSPSDRPRSRSPGMVYLQASRGPTRPTSLAELQSRAAVIPEMVFPEPQRAGMSDAQRSHSRTPEPRPESRESRVIVHTDRRPDSRERVIQHDQRAKYQESRVESQERQTMRDTRPRHPDELRPDIRHDIRVAQERREGRPDSKDATRVMHLHEPRAGIELLHDGHRPPQSEQRADSRVDPRRIHGFPDSRSSRPGDSRMEPDIPRSSVQVLPYPEPRPDAWIEYRTPDGRVFPGLRPEVIADSRISPYDARVKSVEQRPDPQPHRDQRRDVIKGIRESEHRFTDPQSFTHHDSRQDLHQGVPVADSRHRSEPQQANEVERTERPVITLEQERRVERIPAVPISVQTKPKKSVSDDPMLNLATLVDVAAAATKVEVARERREAEERELQERVERDSPVRCTAVTSTSPRYGITTGLVPKPPPLMPITGTKTSQEASPKPPAVLSITGGTAGMPPKSPPKLVSPQESQPSRTSTSPERPPPLVTHTIPSVISSPQYSASKGTLGPPPLIPRATASPVIQSTQMYLSQEESELPAHRNGGKEHAAKIELTETSQGHVNKKPFVEEDKNQLGYGQSSQQNVVRNIFETVTYLGPSNFVMPGTHQGQKESSPPRSTQTLQASEGRSASGYTKIGEPAAVIRPWRANPADKDTTCKVPTAPNPSFAEYLLGPTASRTEEVLRQVKEQQQSLKRPHEISVPSVAVPFKKRSRLSTDPIKDEIDVSSVPVAVAEAMDRALVRPEQPVTMRRDAAHQELERHMPDFDDEQQRQDLRRLQVSRSMNRRDVQSQDRLFQTSNLPGRDREMSNSDTESAEETENLQEESGDEYISTAMPERQLHQVAVEENLPRFHHRHPGNLNRERNLEVVSSRVEQNICSTSANIPLHSSSVTSSAAFCSPSNTDTSRVVGRVSQAPHNSITSRINESEVAPSTRRPERTAITSSSSEQLPSSGVTHPSAEAQGVLARLSQALDQAREMQRAAQSQPRVSEISAAVQNTYEDNVNQDQEMQAVEANQTEQMQDENIGSQAVGNIIPDSSQGITADIAEASGSENEESIERAVAGIPGRDTMSYQQDQEVDTSEALQLLSPSVQDEPSQVIDSEMLPSGTDTVLSSPQPSVPCSDIPLASSSSLQPAPSIADALSCMTSSQRVTAQSSSSTTMSPQPSVPNEHPAVPRRNVLSPESSDDVIQMPESSEVRADASDHSSVQSPQPSGSRVSQPLSPSCPSTSELTQPPSSAVEPTASQSMQPQPSFASLSVQGFQHHEAEIGQSENVSEPSTSYQPESAVSSHQEELEGASVERFRSLDIASPSPSDVAAAMDQPQTHSPESSAKAADSSDSNIPQPMEGVLESSREAVESSDMRDKGQYSSVSQSQEPNSNVSTSQADSRVTPVPSTSIEEPDSHDEQITDDDHAVSAHINIEDDDEDSFIPDTGDVVSPSQDHEMADSTDSEHEQQPVFPTFVGEFIPSSSDRRDPVTSTCRHSATSSPRESIFSTREAEPMQASEGRDEVVNEMEEENGNRVSEETVESSIRLENFENQLGTRDEGSSQDEESVSPAQAESDSLVVDSSRDEVQRKGSDSSTSEEARVDSDSEAVETVSYADRQVSSHSTVIEMVSEDLKLSSLSQPGRADLSTCEKPQTVFDSFTGEVGKRTSDTSTRESFRVDFASSDMVKASSESAVNTSEAACEFSSRSQALKIASDSSTSEPARVVSGTSIYEAEKTDSDPLTSETATAGFNMSDVEKRGSSTSEESRYSSKSPVSEAVSSARQSTDDRSDGEIVSDEEDVTETGQHSRPSSPHLATSTDIPLPLIFPISPPSPESPNQESEDDSVSPAPPWPTSHSLNTMGSSIFSHTLQGSSSPSQYSTLSLSRLANQRNTAYPFSALSLSIGSASSSARSSPVHFNLGRAQSPSSSSLLPRSHEPVPILSDNYEPLSDDDEDETNN